MTVTNDLKQQIDVETAERFFTEMTRGWDSLDVDTVFELRCLFPGRSPHIARFSPDALGISLAVDLAKGMNEAGLNVYPVINPIDKGAAGRLTSAQGAKDSDIVAAYWHWADSDDEASADALRAFAGPRPNMVVITGETPAIRPHAYWRIADGPITDLTAWRIVQEGIAATFGSDATVVNPSRIMRLPGLINWPTKQKSEKGRIPEIATLKLFEDREPAPFERMQRIFASAAPKAKTSSGSFEIDTGGFETLDRERTRIQALEGVEWHNAVIKLVASYVGRGLSDEEIHGLTVPLTLPGYTVDETRKEVQQAIDGARRKGWTPEETPKPFEPVRPVNEKSQAEIDWPTPLSTFDEMALPKRRWVYGYDYIRSFVSVVASAGGVGKTSLAVVEALAIVTDRPLMQTAVKEQTNCWIINLEDPREELVMRTLAAMKHYGIKPDDVRGKLFMDGEDTIQMTLALEGRDGVQLNDALVERLRAKIIENGIGVVIIDPFISTHMVNENSNSSIQAVVALFRALARDTGAAICLVHHIRKGNGEEATVDAVRGAGSLIGAARAVRVINRISERTAQELGVPLTEAKGIFRVDDGKANLAPPAQNAVYRKMIGVQLANEEWVGVAVPFDLPDEWGGMTEDVCNTILAQIDAGPKREDGSEEYFSLRPQDKRRWVGQLITTYPFNRAEDHKTDAQSKMIIKTWLETGLLEEVEYYSSAQRKDRKGVVSTGRVGSEEG